MNSFFDYPRYDDDQTKLKQSAPQVIVEGFGP
jgi:hypothetical protein